MSHHARPIAPLRRHRPHTALARTFAWSVVLACLAGAIGVRDAAAATSAERRFNRWPHAKTAVSIADQYFRQGRHAKAVNWAIRAANCADATAATRAKAARLEHRLRWLLYDQGFGVVEVRVAPGSAVVRVDGQLFRPSSALVRMWLPNGSHQLDVRKPRFHTVRRIITAKAGEHRRVDVKLTFAVLPQVTFVVTPANAEIWLARDFIGFSTKRTFSLPAGKSLIEVRARGYVSWVRSLELKAGEKRTWNIVLDRSAARGRRRTSASNVARRLTPLELANHGERHRLGKRPGTGHTALKPFRGSGQAPDVAPTTERPNWRKVARTGNRAPDMDEPLPSSVEPSDERDEGGMDGGEAAGLSGSGFSNATKGWMYTGVGAALVASGIGAALLGVGQANRANGLTPGETGYDAAYSSAANTTYAGYGGAGIGVLSIAVGGLYLFSEDGLSDTGRGLYLMGAGAVGGAAGAWMMMDAITTAKTANALPARYYSYNTAFDGAEANWRVGIAAAGVGSAVLLTGLFLYLTAEPDGDGDGDVAGGAPAASWFARAHVAPTLGWGRAGASLSIPW